MGIRVVAVSTLFNAPRGTWAPSPSNSQAQCGPAIHIYGVEKTWGESYEVRDKLIVVNLWLIMANSG